MNIIISNTSGKPIYEQIIEQIKHEIITDKLKSHQLLPSMRVLAKELRISLITTKRAYEELERQGYIYTVTGKGSFVSDCNKQDIFDEQIKQIKQDLSQVVYRAKLNNISLDELKILLSEIYKKE